MHPYANLPATSFWRKSVAGRAPEDIDPVTDVSFKIGRTTKVATAGSCFAQHLSRALGDFGFTFFRTETAPANDSDNEFYGMFSAAYGNIYTTAQLHQLLKRAYGLYRPSLRAWQTPGGTFLDPFRPGIRKDGFATTEALEELRELHLACVRTLFERCDVFTFTLGLTETWTGTDGSFVPVIPGAAGAPASQQHYRFVNLGVGETLSELLAFADALKSVNEKVRILLTVSPVPLVATYEKRHVLVSTMLSKSILRAAADEACRARNFIHYFPSYEIVAGHPSRGLYFESDNRSVTPAGVRHVMNLFARHCLGEGDDIAAMAGNEMEAAQPDAAALQSADDEHHALAKVICDEDALDPAEG
jgi:hypothetical protein